MFINKQIVIIRVEVICCSINIITIIKAHYLKRKEVLTIITSLTVELTVCLFFKFQSIVRQLRNFNHLDFEKTSILSSR